MVTEKTINELKNAIRDVPDFPKKGIIFKDITTLLRDAGLFAKTIDLFYEKYNNEEIDTVVCIEARGFIFGGALAYRLGAGLVPVRKKGKLPHKTRSVEYELEYGTDLLEMHEDAVNDSHRILVVDDLLATGGTTKAVVDLIKHAGGKILGLAFLIELEFLHGREKLSGQNIFSLLKM